MDIGDKTVKCITYFIPVISTKYYKTTTQEWKVIMFNSKLTIIAIDLTLSRFDTII